LVPDWPRVRLSGDSLCSLPPARWLALPMLAIAMLRIQPYQTTICQVMLSLDLHIPLLSVSKIIFRTRLRCAVCFESCCFSAGVLDLASFSRFFCREHFVLFGE